MATETHDELLLNGRLAYADPEVVSKELEKYGKRIERESLEYPTEALEKALLSRQDSTIDFALAQYAGSPDIVRALYELSGNDPKDDVNAVYLRALRVACLSNRSCAGILSYFPAHVLGKDEQERLIRDGNREESQALFTNPIIATDLLRHLYEGTEEFEGMDEERRRFLIACSSTNPRLTDDQSDEHGPDMGQFDIQKGILTLFTESPVDKKWFRTLEYFMNNVNPFMLNSPDSEDQAKQIIDKWRDLKLDEGDFILGESHNTALSYLDEFRVDLASMFGCYRNKEDGYKLMQIGSPESGDLLERCAYYGNGDLSIKEMEKALSRDEDVFGYAALQNEGVYGSREKRLLIEERAISGYVNYIYKRRCQQYKAKWKRFDPTPVSEWMRDDEDLNAVVTDSAEEKPQWATELEGSFVELAKALGANQREIAGLKSYLVWILIIVIVLAVKILW